MHALFEDSYFPSCHRIEVLVFVSLLLGTGDACLNTQATDDFISKAQTSWRENFRYIQKINSDICIISRQVLSLLGGSYKAKSAEAFALMKLVQVKLLLPNIDVMQLHIV